MDAREQRNGLLFGQVVEEIEAEHDVVPAAQVVRRRVPPVPVLDPVGHPPRGR